MAGPAVPELHADSSLEDHRLRLANQAAMAAKWSVSEPEQLLYVKLDRREKSMLVSYASTTMAELLTTVRDLILNDTHWKAMARSTDGAEMDLRALFFGGHAYVPGAANTACRLSMIRMHKECRITAALSPTARQYAALSSE